MPIRVSIVEDLAEVREGLVDLVQSDEELSMVSSFKDAESAAQKLPELKADIVLMDINLPGMSGIDCIRSIKEKCPGTQFMMFTVYENDDKVLEALQAGATGYLLKRTKPEQIVESIKELNQGGSPMSSNIARKLLNIFLHEKKATKVCFSVELKKMMKIVIHDNGKGIDWNDQRAFSNGIQNIKKRMNEINGEVVFLNDHGTKVSMTIPIAL